MTIEASLALSHVLVIHHSEVLQPPDLLRITESFGGVDEIHTYHLNGDDGLLSIVQHREPRSREACYISLKLLVIQAEGLLKDVAWMHEDALPLFGQKPYVGPRWCVEKTLVKSEESDGYLVIYLKGITEKQRSDLFLNVQGSQGVEVHIYNVAQCLMQRGHKIIIITRSYGDMCGIRYFTNGMKVYYLPLVAAKLPPGSVTLPTWFVSFPVLRSIFIRERVTVVHGHQTTSNLCHEALFHAGTLGLKTCFTDHSLFGFADASSIHINKVLEWSLRNVDQVICVSNTSRENTVLRAKIEPERVSVIPNATNTSAFTPPEVMKYKSWASLTDKEGLTIIVITRLVYRKGSDLFVDVIPEICRRHPEIKWIIGGDGPRMSQIQQMIERHNLMDRVKLLGALKHSEVRSVLNQGQIFLNCSLTEAFCIALVEASSCGLLCVSTRVGGVPEVLPPNMLLLAEPDPASITTALEEAITRVPYISPWETHEVVRRFYSWNWVAERTERVYDRVLETSTPSLYERLMRYASVGFLYGVICWLLCTIDWLLLTFLEYWFPSELIDIAPDFPFELYTRNREKLAALEKNA